MIVANDIQSTSSSNDVSTTLRELDSFESHFSLSAFALSDIVRCGYAMRQMGVNETSMEAVVDRMVDYLFENCRSEAGLEALALVRFFKTISFGDLGEELQQEAQKAAGDKDCVNETKCLVLLGTAGTESNWNDRKKSNGHRVIPLLNEHAVSVAPMISQMIQQFGLEISSVVAPHKGILTDLDQRNYNVFHVEHAVGSPYIPAQEKFVIPHKIQSVVGFGGMLPTGNLFSLIAFSKTPISRETALAFRTITLKIKAAILPYENGRIFEDDSHKQATFGQEILASKVAALEELEAAYDLMVFRQSERLEDVVREVEASNKDLSTEITLRKGYEREREDLHEKLVSASREAGKAEVATGVLHNVGNVMNSVNVAARILHDKLDVGLDKRLKAAVELLENQDDLVTFFHEGQGQHFVPFMRQLSEEANTAVEDVDALLKLVDHVNSVVAAQQSLATVSGVTSSVDIGELVNSTIEIIGDSYRHRNIEVVTKFENIPEVVTEKQRLVQILVNLLRNAKHAIEDADPSLRRVTIEITATGPNYVQIKVADTGIGISEENKTKIFAHGFSTRKERGGHGFGLHHCFNSAIEMGGRLTVSSPGINQGATFTVELPLDRDSRIAVQTDSDSSEMQEAKAFLA